MRKNISKTSDAATNNNCAQETGAPFRVGQNWRRLDGRWRRGRPTYCGQRNQPVFFGPFAEFPTPPPAVFDIPPRILPANIFDFALLLLQFCMQCINNQEIIIALPSSLNDSGPTHPSSSSSSSLAHSHHSISGKTHCHNVEREDVKPQRNSQKLPSQQLSQLCLEAEITDIQESYVCPPSYAMENYRDHTELTRAAHDCQPFKNYYVSELTISAGEIFQNDKEIADQEYDSLQTLRDRLKKQLEEESYECMICCQIIRASEWIWTCKKCYHMFHINRSNSYGCITQWAIKSFKADIGWRCPSCQNVTFELPQQYRCFCTKKLNPPTQRFPDMPHSCSETCGKMRGGGCIHPCTDQCHPGPCSECPLTISQKCNCGRQIITGRCGKQLEFKCSVVCGKTLNCGLHKCEVICHQGECNECEHVITQSTFFGILDPKCFCGLEERVVACTALNLKITSFSCGAPCTGMYACNVHKCELRCHDKHGRDDCGLCSLSPEKKKYCPCGRMLIADLEKKARTSCTDPVPTCKNVCGKVLSCGSEVENPYLCPRRCKKLKTCKNHRCRDMCCINEEHVCTQICGKKLNCGIHNCDRLCHVGQCPRCLRASFEEQYCLCGQTIREPPVPCGTSLPPCNQACSRQHSCDHPPMHSCHAESECPPCTVLTQKPCYGAHEIRSNIPCFLNDVSCGRPCDKELSCKIHRCKRICHAGQCLVNETICQQPCNRRRIGEACDHICGLPCHGDTPCPKTKVAVTCSCLRKSSEMHCCDVEKAYQKILSLKVMEDDYSNIAAEKRPLKRNLSADKYRCLPCDVDCQRALRNKKVAEILNISRPDVGIPASAYTTFLKNKLETHYDSILDVEGTLIKLVHDLDSRPNVTSVSHSFPPMNSEQRRIIHEYSEHFGIETVSHGKEPRRNVVATAKRDISYMPAVLLTAAKRDAAASFVPTSNGVAIVPSKTLSLIPKKISAENRMQQLQSAGRVLKRGVKEPMTSQKQGHSDVMTN
ncbi:unnamed protein product [Litomosoides sigmodontis]|uniref:R3H domain-containing protein n=1 Tax=Litomosoides sigmodontis TaxID=42156 RepID=A0A3P6T6C3_LITSI|nr:unnamed protein product [Litomosoides sigmodontis]